MASSSSQQVNQSNANIYTTSTGHPISLVGTMGIVQTGQRLPQSINILQNQLTPQQIAAIQQHQRSSPQHQLGNVRPGIVNFMGNQSISLQNVQVLGSMGRQPDGMGNVPISIITSGGQTYAVASNLHTGMYSQGATAMQIRPIAPNAAAVVQANSLSLQQIRTNVPRIATAGTPSVSNFPSSPVNKTVQQISLTVPLQQRTSPANTSSTQVLTKRKLQDLLNEIDPTETMDEDVEETLLQLADDFIENVINSSCQIAKHRKSTTLEVKDMQLHLDRNWNMWIPGFGSEDLRPYKKLPSTEAHRQRMALIKKAMKK
ncbi:transcription initiation factor TFIID subunit 12 isoform X1 [Hydra vulgaris]|nr:transcription initiation factor TFIID subunit 12 [Hydra vulgaris]